jgi:hypothetical protein
MAHIFENVKVFSEQSKDLAEATKIYAQNIVAEQKGDVKAFSAHSKDEMEDLIDKAFCAEIEKQTGMTIPVGNKTELARYANRTSVKEFADEIRDTMIDAILPILIDNSAIRYFADVKYADIGDSIKFDIESNAMLTVSRADYRRRKINSQKTFDANITMTGENHMVTVSDNLFDILAGRSHIARDVMRAGIAIEKGMLIDAYNAFTTSMNGLSGNLAVANYSEDALVKLCQTVTAYNNGRKAVIIGTPLALKKVLPQNGNYRYMLDSEYVKLGRLQEFNSYDVLPMEQIADPDVEDPYKLLLDDTKIYVVSPASDKIVKIGVFGGVLSSTIDAKTTANKTQSQTIEKSWEVAVATNSVAGVVKNFN